MCALACPQVRPMSLEQASDCYSRRITSKRVCPRRSSNLEVPLSSRRAGSLSDIFLLVEFQPSRSHRPHGHDNATWVQSTCRLRRSLRILWAKFEALGIRRSIRIGKQEPSYPSMPLHGYFCFELSDTIDSKSTSNLNEHLASSVTAPFSFARTIHTSGRPPLGMARRD